MKKDTLKKIIIIMLIASCNTLQNNDLNNNNNQSNNQIQKKDEYGNVIQPAINIKKNEMPLKNTQINKSVLNANECIVNTMQEKFRLNNTFIKLISYDNNAKSIKIYNPYNGNEGIIIDIIPVDQEKNTSIIKLYANGIPKVSKAWFNIIKYCKN